MPQFVSKPIVPQGGAFDVATMSHGEPSLPPAFAWDGAELRVERVLRTWRSTKDDRGETYLKRHWFEFETGDGRTAVVYFERGAKRGQPRWFLFTIDEPTEA